MLIRKTKLCQPPFPAFPAITSSRSLEQTIRDFVEAETYHKIPDLLSSLKGSFRNPNPFFFLSAFPQGCRTRVIDEILQSWIPLRPRTRARTAYSCLLSCTLQCPNPLPLALAVLQHTLRSGSLPVPQTHVLLSSAWLDRRRECESHSVANVLQEMQSVGCQPDCGTCNYLISSLCAVDELKEAVNVLRGMGRAGCAPDSESYGIVIAAMCAAWKTGEAMGLVKEMVVKNGLSPRQGIVGEVAAALRARREIWRAVEMVELLEREGYPVRFEVYESVLEGCLECKEYILAGKMVMWMTEKGFIPYIKTRQKVVDGLVAAGSTSQSTSSCSERDTKCPVLILLMPSIAATVENAQKLPAFRTKVSWIFTSAIG